MNNVKNKLIIAITTLLFLLPLTPRAQASSGYSVSGGGRVNTNTVVSVTVNASRSDGFDTVSLSVSFSNLIYISNSYDASWQTTPGGAPRISGSTLTFSAGTLGSSQTSKPVIRLNFKTLSTAGTASVTASGQIINAGVAQSASSGSTTFSVVTPPPAPSPSPTPKPAPNALTIASSSHPDVNAWYKSKEIVLSWNKQDGVTDFSSSLDSIADTNPGDTGTGSETTRTIGVASDGIYYFHIKARNDVGWGPASHYPIRIDSTAPDPFTTTKIGEETSAEFTLYFATADATSGVSKFTVAIDGQDKGEQKSGQVKVSKDAKTITVTASDKAGNTTQSTLDLQKAPVTTLIAPSATGTQQTVVVEKKSSSNIVTIAFAGAALLMAVYSVVISYLYIRLLDRNKKLGTISGESAEQSPLTVAEK
jgi:hypothetical protein